MALDLTVRPQIFVYLTNENLEATIQNLLHGIEEEQVPYHISVVAEQDSIKAAYEAAVSSSLNVGIGCDGQKVVLHYKNLEPNQPYLVIDRYQTVPKEALKAFGSNSARLVKGVPFKDLDVMEVKR